MLSLGKWTKYKMMKQSPELAGYLPETAKLDKTEFWRLLRKYGGVIVKPSRSYGGNGVVQVTVKKDGRLEVRTENRQEIFTGEKHLYRYVQKITGRNYIVQQKIPRITVDKRPCDFRVMVQRKRNDDWTVTGKLAKVAGHGYIITNIRRSKGKVLPAEEALKLSSLANASPEKLLAAMDELALKAARHLQHFYPQYRMFGFDMCVDQQGKVWIIEANVKPALSLFRQFKDKQMYTLIMRYVKKK